MTRVLVAASSPVARAGLEALLGRDDAFTLVGDGADGGLLDQIEGHDPDVVVVELSPDDDPLSVPTEPDERPSVVLLVGPLDAATVGELLRAGARGLLPRESDGAQIVAAVHAAAVGVATIHPSYLVSLATAAADALDDREPAAPALPVGASSALVERLPSSRADGSGARDLTPREVEVLRMLAEGLANKQIAARLGISDHTVKFHVAAIFAKLRASSRTEAVMLGARRGLILL